MTTLSEDISKLFDMFPHRTAEEVIEDAMSTIDKLQTFTTGVLVGQGMKYEDAVEIVKAIMED